MQRFETRFSGKITSINVSGIQRAGCRDGMQQAGMMPLEGLQPGSTGLERSNSDCMDHRATGPALIRAATARWGLQTPHFGLLLSHEQLFSSRNETKGQADLWTLCLPDTSVMILHNIPVISKELSHSQWVITTAQSCVNTRWQKPMSLQWFLAREKLQMQVNYCFFIQAHLSSNENCKCQPVAEIECSISTWGFSAFLDIYSKKPMN